MRNNWAVWKKVQETKVDIGARNLDIQFAMPINASNILIEFISVSLSKPASGKEKDFRG